MKCVILAGGQGTRLGDITKGLNKHLLPVGREPMIVRQVRFAHSIGFTAALIVTSPESVGDFVRVLNNFNLGVRCYFTVQDKPAGAADAIVPAANYCDFGPVFVLLGDNLFDSKDQASFRIHLHTIDGNPPPRPHGCHVWLTEHPNPREYGVLVTDAMGRPLQVVEKPPEALATHHGVKVITGAYLFDDQIWRLLGTVGLSSRGEYEITTLLQRYLDKDQLHYGMLQGPWADLGQSIEDYYKHAVVL